MRGVFSLLPALFSDPRQAPTDRGSPLCDRSGDRRASTGLAALIGELPEKIGHFTRSRNGIFDTRKPSKNLTH
jgi:hypothetical protein